MIRGGSESPQVIRRRRGPRPSRSAPSRRWLPAALLAAASLAAATAPATPAAAGITLLEYPHELVAINEQFTVSWEEPVRCRIEYGWAPGHYTESTSGEGVQSLSIVALTEGMEPGIHYCVVADVASPEVSEEFTLIIESPALPAPTAPPGGSVLHATTTLLEWDPVDGVPYYHVIVSDTEAEIREVDGELVLDGANLIWQAITGGTSIQYGSLDPSGHFVASNGMAPPLMSGFQYNWFVLNNYGNHPLMTSVVGAGLSSFTVDVPVDLTAPLLVSPPDSAVITESMIEFEWDGVAGASGYYVYLHEKRTLGGGEASHPVWSGVTTQSRADVHLGSFLPAGDYRWRVVAVDEAGRGAASDVRSFVFETETGVARVVTQADGAPVPWVLTEIEFVAGGVDVIPVVTNEDGVAEKALVPGEYAFHATKHGYVDTTAQETVSAGQTTQVVIEMRTAPARIRGLVVDQEDEPVFDAELVAVSGELVVDGESDSNGNFVLLVTPGTWGLVARKQGYEPAGPETVAVAPGSYVELTEPLTLVGIPGAATGVVTNPGGGPVVGATVRSEGEHGASAATTSASGRFALDLAQGPWSIWAEKLGFQPSEPREIFITPGGSTEVDPPIVLEPIASSIMGRVTDGGTHVVGADVMAVPPAGEPVTAATNCYGEFVVVPPASTYRLTATSGGFGPSAPHQITLDWGESFTGVDLILETLDSSISGTVVSSGAGVAGALVTDGLAEVLTRPDGTFTLGVPHGVHGISASKEGHLPRVPLVVGTSPGQLLEGVVLEIAEGAGSITGRVTHDGSPVVGALVISEASTSRSQALTDDLGEFRLSVEAGEWTVTATKDGFSEAEPVNVVLAAGQSASGIDLSLDDVASILRGNIGDSRGPVRRATILVWAEGEPDPAYRTSSSSNGQYVVRLAPDTDYVLEASAERHASKGVTVPALPPGGTATLDLTLPAREGSIAGTITDGGGAPIEGVRVVASWSDSTVARTDRFGTFTVWLDDGLYDVRFDRPGYRTETRAGIEVVSGEVTGIDVTLAEAFASVEGTITDFPSGAPLSGVLATAVWHGGAASVMSGEDGRYELRAVVPGGVTVCFTAVGYRTAAEEITLGESESVVLNPQLLELTGTIAGTVRESGFGGIAGVAVRAKLAELVASTAWTDEDGHYVLSGLDPGSPYDVYASRDGYYSDSQNPLVGVPTQTLDADFSLLPSTGRITGYVLDATDLTALAGAGVTASDGLGHFGAATSNEGGAFEIDGLPPLEDYDLTVTLYGYTPATVEGVHPGTEGLAVELTRNFARISGRLIPLGDGVTLADVAVVATSTAYAGGSATGDPDEFGLFEIAELRPGGYILSISGGGHVSTPTQMPLSVGEGDVVTGLDFTVERAEINRIDVTGPTVIQAGSTASFSGDAFSEDDRLLEADLAWSVSPACAGEIGSGNGTLECDPDYIGELTVAARENSAGVAGRLFATACAVVGPSTEVVLADSAGMRLEIGPGSVEETKSIYLSHEVLSDAKRVSRDFEVQGLSYRLKPNGLAFSDDRRPVITLPSPAPGAVVALWDRDLLRWERQDSQVAADGLALPIARLGEYATITDSRSLGVSGIRVEPNPFSPDNGAVRIVYNLSSDLARTPFVTIRIYNMTGQLVRRLVDHRPQPKGSADAEWNGITDDAELARNGRYVIEIEAEDSGSSVKELTTVVLVK